MGPPGNWKQTLRMQHSDPEWLQRGHLSASECVSPLCLLVRPWLKYFWCKETHQTMASSADIGWTIYCTWSAERKSELEKRGLDRAWMERALFSMSPMFCSACACLACPPPPPHFSLYSLPSSVFPHSLPTTSAPSPTPSHISAIPSPSACGWRQGGVRETLSLSAPGTTWRPERGLDVWQSSDDAKQMFVLYLDLGGDEKQLAAKIEK